MNRKSETCLGRGGKPLTEYDSRREAAEGADYVKHEYGNDMAPYQCPTCAQWHISPKDRQTPSTDCNYCTDSGGGSKALYETEESAQRRAKILHADKSVSLQVYKCPYNDGWHLSKG